MHEHQVGRFHGHVRASGDGDAHIGLHQGRGVVDAVADHADAAPIGLENAHDLGLVAGEHFGAHLVDAHLASNSGSRLPAITRYHGHPQAGALEVGDVSGAGRARHVGQTDEPGQPAVHDHPHRSLTGVGQRCRSLLGKFDFSVVGHHLPVAHHHPMVAYASAGAVAGHGQEVGHLFQLRLILHGFLNNGPGERMLGALLHGRGQREERGCGPAVERNDVGDGRFAPGDGAGLVEDDSIETVRLFQSLRTLDQDTELGPPARADHDRRRSGQPQAARTGDDEHGHEDLQGESQTRAAQQPGSPGQQGDADHRGHEVPGDHVGQPGDGRLSLLGILDQADDLRQDRVAAHAGGAHGQQPFFVDAAADHPVPFFLGHRQGLASEHRLIHGRTAVDHLAVGGHSLARAHAQQVASLDLGGGNGALLAVDDYSGVARLQVDQRLDRLAGAVLGQRLQIAAQKHQGDDGGYSREIGVEGGAPAQGHVRQTPGTEQEGSGRAHGDQRKHIGPTVQQGAGAVGVDAAADPEHRQHEQQVHKADAQRVARKGQSIGHGQAGHAAHLQDEEGNPEDSCGNQRASLGLDLGLLATLPVFGDIVPLDDLEPRVDDGLLDIAQPQAAAVVLDPGLFSGQVDLDLGDAVELGHLALDPPHAGCAGHAANAQGDRAGSGWVFFCGRGCFDRLGSVPGLFHGPGDARGVELIRVKANAHAFGGQVDLDVVDAVEFSDFALDAAHAGRAGHAVDGEVALRSSFVCGFHISVHTGVRRRVNPGPRPAHPHPPGLRRKTAGLSVGPSARPHPGPR